MKKSTSHNMRSVKVIVSFLTFLFFALSSFAQDDDLTKALRYYQEGNLQQSKNHVDKAAKVSKDPWVWFFRGFVYKEIYKKDEISNPLSPSRLVAFESFKKSMNLDEKGEHIKQNTDNLKYLASRFFNDVADDMDTANYNRAIENYQRFKEAITAADPNQSLIKQDVEFHLALGSVFMLYHEKSGKKEYMNLARDAFQKVLDIDSNNISANFNLGILYYNQAVSLIVKTDYDIDLTALEEIQDESIVLFRESLPFMEKAYDLDPSRAETLMGLSGIYFSLNEKDKYVRYQDELRQVKNKK